MESEADQTSEEVPGLQHERTALAWERTSIAFMVAGVVFTRVVSTAGHPWWGLIGVMSVAGGGSLLWWAAANDNLLHDPSSPPSAVPQVGLTRVVGVGAFLIATVSLAAGAAIVT